MGKHIRFDDAARESLRRGVDQLAGAVRVTLGPRGRNVVIERGHGSPTITNDGLTIAHEIELENPFENMGVQLVKEVALRTGEAAGDGTTTATVLAHGLVCHGLQAVAAGHNPMAVKRGIDRAVLLVVEDLRLQSRQVRDRDDLSRIAALGAGDDPVIGGLIAEAMERVGRLGVITVDEGRGMQTTLEVVEGVRFERGYLSPYFVTVPDTMDCVLVNPLVLLVNERVTSAAELLPALGYAANAGRPLMLIADDVEGEALATLVVNRLRGNVESVAIRAPEAGAHQRQAFEDLSVLTGARLYAPDLGLKLEEFRSQDFGSVQRAVVDRDRTTMLGGGGRADEIRKRIGQIEREIKSGSSAYDREWLRVRLARMTNRIAVIRVGAATELELGERKARAEDALAATRSAVEEGLVLGGGVALLRSQARLVGLDLSGGEKVGVEIVRQTLEEPARQIAENAGERGAVVIERIRSGGGSFGFNALTCEFGDLEAFGILDPVKVTRCALQHAASIGTLVLTTDAIVVDASEDEEETEEGEEEEEQ